MTPDVAPVEIRPMTTDQFEPLIPDPNQVQIVTLVPSGQFQPVTQGPIPTVTSVEIQPVTPDQFQLVVPDQSQPEIQDQFQPMTIVTPVESVTPVTPVTSVTPVTPIQPVTFRCDQTISYRDLDYLTAVDVMENENYLEETFDIDEIRFFRRQGYHRNAPLLTSKIERIRRQADVVKNGMRCCHFFLVLLQVTKCFGIVQIFL